LGHQVGLDNDHMEPAGAEPNQEGLIGPGAPGPAKNTADGLLGRFFSSLAAGLSRLLQAAQPQDYQHHTGQGPAQHPEAGANSPGRIHALKGRGQKGAANAGSGIQDAGHGGGPLGSQKGRQGAHNQAKAQGARPGSQDNPQIQGQLPGAPGQRRQK